MITPPLLDLMMLMGPFQLRLFYDSMKLIVESASDTAEMQNSTFEISIIAENELE